MIMLVFLASTCVVMLNIFIAQLSSRYKDEMQNAEERFEKRRIATMEDRSFLWRICYVSIFLHCIHYHYKKTLKPHLLLSLIR